MVLGPSNIGGKIETSFLIVVSACVVLLVAVTVTMLVFLYKYNRKRHPVPKDIKENIPLEIIWTVIPTILVIFMFYFGWVDFDFIRNPPKDAMNIDVISRQWSWTFRYENGRQSDTLKVPVGKPVKLTLMSEDVIHCLFIPAYRVKEDCVPGLKTHLWFTANEAGTYNIFCTEYCGLEHSHMLSKLITMSLADFNAWYQAGPEVKGKETGPELLQTKGCLGCHTTDGTPKVGPTFKGLYGGKVTVLTGGRERVITADREYLRRSVLEPAADIVKGYPNIMPKLPITEEDLDEIVDYLETLR
ncbi:MAG: cytochrome c oxidase subunit II [Thermodesulfovibrionales bacterium]